MQLVKPPISPTNLQQTFCKQNDSRGRRLTGRRSGERSLHCEQRLPDYACTWASRVSIMTPRRGIQILLPMKCGVGEHRIEAVACALPFLWEAKVLHITNECKIRRYTVLLRLLDLFRVSG
jgi:hypothetical protein